MIEWNIVMDGNLLDHTDSVLVHQVNASGGFDSGVAGAIASKWPCVKNAYHSRFMAGDVQLGHAYLDKACDGTIIASVCAQMYFGGDGQRYTSYDALIDALDDLVRQLDDTEYSNVAFPYGMSCGLAGADWSYVRPIIEAAFRKSTKTYSLRFWKLKQ